MARRVRQAFYWIVAGGLAFWLPVIIVDTISGHTASVVTLNIAPAIGLALLAAASRVRHSAAPRWDWVLAGVYILGPAAIVLWGYTAHGGAAASRGAPWFVLLLCLFPPTTLWFATLTGTIFAVLAATVGVPLLYAYREMRSGMTPASRNAGKAA